MDNQIKIVESNQSFCKCCGEWVDGTVYSVEFIVGKTVQFLQLCRPHLLALSEKLDETLK